MPRPTPGWKPRVPSGMVGCRGAPGSAAVVWNVPCLFLSSDPFASPLPSFASPPPPSPPPPPVSPSPPASRKVLFSLNAAADAHCE